MAVRECPLNVNRATAHLLDLEPRTLEAGDLSTFRGCLATLARHLNLGQTVLKLARS